MTCVDFENLILDRIDGRLAPELEPAMHDHVAVCESCRVFLATQTELDRALLDAPQPTLSPHFSSRVLARLEVVDRRDVVDTRHAVHTRDVTDTRPRLAFAWDLAGLAGVAAAAAFCVAHFFPAVVVGGPWIAAGAVLCGGACLTLAEPPVPFS